MPKSKSKGPKNPDAPVTPGQSLFVMRLLNTGAGFAGFVPNWREPVGDEKATKVAAALLTEAGATRGSAHGAIEYLKASSPTTKVGRAHRQQRGIALLFATEPQPAPVREEVLQVSKTDLDALVAAAVAAALANNS